MTVMIQIMIQMIDSSHRAEMIEADDRENCTLALELMGIKKFKILDIIPALAIIPIVHYIHGILKPLLASYL